jgi:hypothetical protein
MFLEREAGVGVGKGNVMTCGPGESAGQECGAWLSARDREKGERARSFDLLDCSLSSWAPPMERGE